MTDTALTPERILEAAEEILRRFGPAKANVVDVARALGVSHGSVYRHFPSTAALRDAVAERWLGRMMTPLSLIAAERGPAPERLHRWLRELTSGKRRKVLDDPELFAAYHLLAVETCGVVEGHVEALAAQVTTILADGLAQGAFALSDPAASARAVLSATARFHHPAHASDWASPTIDAEFETVWHLVLRGLKA